MAPRIDLLLSVLLLIVLPLSAHGQSSGIDLSLDQFIVQPGSGCGPRTIGAVISNQSAVTFAAPLILPITYTIDDGVNPVTNGQSIGFSFVSLIPGQPVMINLPGTIMLTEPLAHVITATLVINGDIVPANNIASTTILGPQPITSLPWLETFDGLGWNGLGDGSTVPPPCWNNVQGENNSGIGSDWLFRTGSTGTPGTGPSIGFSGGVNDFYGFCEDTGSDHDAVELLTPFINLSGLPGAEVTVWVHSENSLGFGTGENQLHIDLVPYPSGIPILDIRPPIGHTPGGWFEVTINLNSWVGSLVQIRFRAEMDGGIGMDTHDIAIDAVRVALSQGVDLELESIDSPAQGSQLTCNQGSPVSVTVRNHGPATLGSGTALPIAYTFDDGINPPVTVSEMRQLTTPLIAGAALLHTFSAPLSVPPLTTVSISASVTLQWDANPLNNVLSGHQYTNAGAPSITAFPAVENFDQISWNGSGFGTTAAPASCWVNVPGENGASLHKDWYFANGSVGLSSTGPVGDHTSGFGSYAYAKVDAMTAPHTTTLVSPAFDVAQLSHPVASFWVHSLRASGTSASLHIDLLHGTTNSVLQTDMTPPIGDLGSNNWTPTFAPIDIVTYGTNIRLRFRFVAPVGASVHDIAIDDLVLRSAAGQPAADGIAEFDISNAEDSFGFPVRSWIGGPFVTNLTTGSPMHLTVVGAPQSGCLLLAGPLNVGIRTYPGIGQLDLGIPPILPSPQGLSILADGITGTSLLDMLFNTGSTGTMVLDMNLNVPPGNTFPLQVILSNGGSSVISITNAIVLNTL